MSFDLVCVVCVGLYVFGLFGCVWDFRCCVLCCVVVVRVCTCVDCRCDVVGLFLYVCVFELMPGPRIAGWCNACVVDCVVVCVDV